MKTMKQTGSDSFDSFNENKSLEVIREMIQVSQKKLKNNGILFIVWGWVMFIHYMVMFLVRKIVLTHQLNTLLNYLIVGLVIGAILFTVYYLNKQRKKVQTYIGISLRYVWIGVFICMMLINLIQFNVLHKIHFELQHPIFMVVLAFAIVITGAILRYKLIIWGGIFFAFSAYLASRFSLPTQMLIDAIAWMVAFILPGHYLYAKRNK